MDVKKILNKKIDRLNEIFERNHLPYVADPIHEKNAAEIIDIDEHTNTGIYVYMPVPIDGKCAMCMTRWHNIIDVIELKLVRDICDCLLELNNMALTKSETKEANQGANYSDAIKAIMNNSELMYSTINQLTDMIPTYFDSITYESIIAVVSNTRIPGATMISSVKSICTQACNAGDRRN